MCTGIGGVKEYGKGGATYTFPYVYICCEDYDWYLLYGVDAVVDAHDDAIG